MISIMYNYRRVTSHLSRNCTFFAGIAVSRNTASVIKRTRNTIRILACAQARQELDVRDLYAIT